MRMFGRHKYDIRLITAFAVVLLPLVFWFGYPFLTSWVFGGDALGGKIEDGHFYLGSHGKYTEVSRPGYIASACGVAFWALSLIAAIGGAGMFSFGREWAGASIGRKFGMILGVVAMLSAAALIAYLTFGAIAAALKT